MNWDGITINLVSEAIGIAFTVFGVDELIKFRHKRKWYAVHQFFWDVVSEECMRLNESFAEWLTLISNFIPSTTSQLHPPIESQRKGSSFGNRSINFDVYDGIQPFGCDFARFAAMAKKGQTDQFLSEFLKVLGPIVLDNDVRNDSLWQRLAIRISPSLSRLEQLVTTHGSLIEPRLAFAVLRLNRDLDNIRRGTDTYSHISANASLSEWSDHLDRSMQSALAALLALNAAARKQ
jgi:hypothetical protein